MPIIAERDTHGRAFLLDLAIILGDREILDKDSKPTRACPRVHITAFEECFVDPLPEVLAEGLHERPQRFWRQLFGADLDEEVPGFTHDFAPLTDSTIGKPSASRLS